ncbi:MAG TPA: S41 family peptidase [Syntrophales bacterium]|nr:S41 family peptidase [Syntrophales bacterium]
MKDMHKRVFLLLCLLACFVLFGLQGDSQVSAALERGIYKNLKTFNEVLDIVQKNYVEEIESKKLIEGAINGMMKSLDPHSTYMTADMYKELEVETRGSFGGIGIEITIKKDVLTVVSPIEDTPAFNAGIKAGDQIIQIDGISTKDITIMEAVKKLRGPKDSKVTVTIIRENITKPKEFVITRDIIKIKSIKSKIFDDRIGYIRISSFQERTVDDLKKEIKNINAKVGAPLGLILDLRNNPGGLLNQAIGVADIFLKSGIIVSTKGRTKSMDSQAVAKDDGDEPTCPIVVLVNEGTASASEIVSGALQDNGRALVIGTQTFGKGSVQTVIPLEEGSALKLTTAKYYTPNGRSIQAEGIKPDIIVKYIKPTEDKEPTDDFIRERDLKGHIKSKKEQETNAEDSLKREQDILLQDNQLKSAIDIIKSWDIMKKNLKS